ncbi:hypothetical protein BLL37_31185 [Pseudomonas azotoformans]|uniref:LysM domain-containing protein n=1 Tax=Pseudomonas azotoformans TaxID=47878 RepID=A0A1V2J3I8_PSEAZ|nr:LysM peptidoglycan-binding domain-containing protein [Pseudomonas azotoformans]OIN45257.1 hypothetical protein BFL39_24450 [Pseudomonas azotoformans]ONH39825.1 hypothetical protein BLL37_31185 [Pseudomonas azotoformans]SDM97740.1 LysM domain-containing protein [Pseudomonas azotoformans]
MTDPAVQKLRDAFATAPAGPVAVNADFWMMAGVAPPSGFNSLINAAFRLPLTQEGLLITYDRGAVTPADEQGFQITGVGLSFLDAPADTTSATLYCTPGTAQTPLLGIDVVPAGWQLSDQFPAMSPDNWPFTLIAFDQQRFYFASAPQPFGWNAQLLMFDAGQNLYGLTSIPDAISALFPLLSGLPAVGPNVLISGAIELDKVDNATILLPDMNLRAPLAGVDLTLFFIEVSDPHLTFRITTAEGELPSPELGEPSKTQYFQQSSYGLGINLVMNGADGSTVGMALSADASPTGERYRFNALALDDRSPITPAAMIKLMGESFFNLIPPVLQEYLASVQMQGISISGQLAPKMTITSLSTRIGSVQSQPIVLFSDPTSNQVFQLDEFSLAWLISNPLESRKRKTNGSLMAAFKLFPEVFKTKDGKPGGLFKVTIDQDLNFAGSFEGRASLDDVLNGITGGAIGLPEGVAIDFSDIYVKVSPSRKSYGLGFQVDAALSVPFVQYTDTSGQPQPLIQIEGLVFDLAANTPNRTDGQPGKSVYAGSMVGQIIVGPLAADVSVVYDGTAETPVWTLDAALAQPLVLSDVIEQFFLAYNLPDFLPGTLTVEALAIHASIPVTAKSLLRAKAGRPHTRTPNRRHPRNGWRSPVRAPTHPAVLDLHSFLAVEPANQSAYSLSTRIRWVFDLTPDIPVDILAELGLDYDGNRKAGEQFAGSAIGTIDIDFIGAIQIGYRFGAPTAPDGALLFPSAVPGAGNSTLWMSWKGFRAEYDFGKKVVAFSLTGWTVGSLITALMDMLGDPYFTLPDPWSVLNTISLNGFSLQIDLNTGVKNRVTAKYTLPSPINLGFLTINGLQFLQADGKVTLAIDGSTTVPGLNDQPLFNPQQGGQDVKDMPTVPGQGNAYFDLKLLALGQRIAIAGAPDFKTTQGVIKALEAVPPSSGPGMPFDPGQRTPGQPYYSRSSNWLGAMHFGVLRIGDTAEYAIDFMVVFNDPDLYGMRLALNGDKMKVLAGLAIDVLYKKVTDDIGCYQIEFTLPSVLRNLDFGAFSVTLPVIGLQIYTNGDFLVDFGFPYNMDFSRSFTVQAIIYGVPVLGSGGFYFGKLSNATAPNLPKTTRGTFHPVIVFGFGAQLGIGRYIDKGILKAGFSITVFGIIEGTLASWHPYQIGNSGSANEVQGDYYFKIAGTFGIIGKLYGSIDFAIIKADVNLTVVVYLKIEYESFRKIPLTLSASVNVSVSIKIDLGLFSIKISLSFSASITEQLTIGSDSQAPWDGSDTLAAPTFTQGKALTESRSLPLPRTLHEHGVTTRPFQLDFTQAHRLFTSRNRSVDKVAIEITAITQFTVLAAEGAGYAGQEGALVLLFAMDAPTVDGGGVGDQTSFGKLCHALLPWLIESVVPKVGSNLFALPSAGANDVSRPLLEGILQALSDPAQAPFTATQLLDFLAANFSVTVSAAQASLTAQRQAELDAGSTIFPAVSFLSMEVPDPNSDSASVTVNYDNYVTATPAYQAELRAMFNSVAAHVSDETAPPRARTALLDASEPLAASVFSDYFILLARQLVQSALDGFDDYPFPLVATTSLQSILDWANGLLDGQLKATPLAQANLNYPLNTGLKLDIANIAYMVQAADTLAAIAARYADPLTPDSTTPAALILANQAQSNLIAAPVLITLIVGGKAEQYTTQVGDDFNSIARAFGLTLEQLATESTLYGMVGLLRASVVLTIPHVVVTTAAGDTIASVIDALRVPLDSFLTAANLALPGLFKVDAGLRFAVPGLVVLPQDSLWQAVLATGTLAQTAGTAARYMLHGMRLPVAPGLNIPANGFLYGAPHWASAQAGYGIYQLTGQQFPLAVRTGTYPVTLTRPDDPAHAWFTLGSGASLTFDIDLQTSLLSKVVACGQQNGYRPQVEKLIAEPLMTVAPTHYNVGNAVTWLTSDMANLVAVSRPQGKVLGDASATPQVKPLLFDLSSALLTTIETKQAALASRIASTSALMPYMPVLSASVGISNPATSLTTYSDVEDCTFATRIEFRIKQLAQDADLAPEQPNANDVVPPGPGNPGSAARSLAKFAYEIIGPNPAQAVLLERWLTAMASEGEHLASGLFLLYGDVNNGANGLTGRADSEFLSFIVQSNLSTETNPPQSLKVDVFAKAEPPSGIANTPAEFIKLLWELSTVNSGGSYLFYQLLAEGTGLPPALFDESGIGTLTLVVTLRRDAVLAKGQRIFNGINALLTTAAIDPQSSVVQLCGVDAPTASLALAADASIAGISDAYAIDIAGLAGSNADAPLVPGKSIPVSGLYHQLLPGDVGNGKDPIAAMAAYYSVGVTPPVTVDAIKQFNLGVAVEPQAVFRVPPFTYTVGADGPGNTLSTMAEYYQADLAALAFGAREVGGLFAQTTVTINPVALDATPNLGLTNAALTLERERGLPPVTLGANPTQAEIDAYTRATLLQLYQLLSARIVATRFFKPSVESAAFGPKDVPTTPAQGRVRKSGSGFVAAAEESPYLYSQALGFGALALINPAPTSPLPGLPAPESNPYVGIGTLVQLQVDWQDLFGNRTPSPFSDPAVGDPQPFGNVPMALMYSDRLIPLDAWPSTTRGYRYKGAAGAPVLNIVLAFDHTPYEPKATNAKAYLNTVRFGDVLPVWQRNAEADLARFRLIYFQLNQNYDGLGVEGLAGPAVSMSLVNSLLATPEQPLPDAARGAILDYVNQAVVYLAARAVGSVATPPQPADVSIPVDISTLTRGSDIIRLDLALRLSRQADLVAPALRALRDGRAVVSTIPVDASLDKTAPDNDNPVDAPAYPIALRQFAVDFEKVFVTADWQMRLGTSSADPATPNDARTPTVWAVRMAKRTGNAPQGIGFQIGNAPCYFAPLPIASRLQTLQVDVDQYQSGQPYPAGTAIPTTFTNADPNVWLAECLAAIDDTLGATYATPMFQLDRLLGLSENPSGAKDPKAGYLYRLLQSKKVLASAIASTATPVLKQSAGDLKPAAVDKLEQALLRRLSNANSLTCVAVFPVTNAQYGPALPSGVIAPRLFGQPTGDLGNTSALSNDNFALSTAKIPLVAGADVSSLAFLVNSRSAESEAYVQLDLAYALTHVEHDIHGVSGIENYQQSRWVTFLTGPYSEAIKPATGTRFAIPVALRALPVPATVVAQTGRSSVVDPLTATPAELKSWTYRFSYLQQQAAQDSVIANVVFNSDADGQMLRGTPSPTEQLYMALAQFVAIYPAVNRDLETFLRPIDGKTVVGNPNVERARDAVDALDTVVSGVAEAFAAWAASQSMAARVLAADYKVEYTFEIRLVPDGLTEAAQVQVLPQAFTQYEQPSSNFLPAAKVLIDPDNYAPEQVSFDPATGAVTWRYELRKDAKDPSLPAVLPYETARLTTERAVEFADLDLFALQNGWASIQVTRNRHLAPDPAVQTTPAFEFASAVSRFADAMVPLLQIPRYALDRQAPHPQTVTQWLDGFFAGLLAPTLRADTALPVLLGLQSSYAYNLVPDGDKNNVPPTVIPVSLLAPTLTAGEVHPPFIAQVGNANQQWFQTAQPVRDRAAGFIFGLTVFSGTGTNRLPLLKIDALTLAAKNIAED